MNDKGGYLLKLEKTIRDLQSKKSLSSEEEYALTDACRTVLKSFTGLAEINVAPEGLKRWQELSTNAIRHLGGVADRSSTSLKNYNHLRYGPYLGVSDDGDSASIIRTAALNSPKAKVLDSPTPLQIGVALDLERLGAVGEVTVGPEEYANVWTECTDRILMTTNVGTRANVRFYLQPPLITISKGSADWVIKKAKKALRDEFRQYLNTLDGKPRPLTVFIEFEKETKRPFEQRRDILIRLRREVETGSFADKTVHKIGFNQKFGWGVRGLRSLIKAIDLTREAGLTELSADGVVRKEADRMGSMPGLLHYLPAGMVAETLRHANKAGIHLRTRNAVDVDTVARSIWSTLNTARTMGLDLGKYGLFPLTYEESIEVVGMIQEWFSHWSAAPVFFVDQGLLSFDDVAVGRDHVMKGLNLWLQMVKDKGVEVVLIDTVDKAKGWRILRNNNDDSKGLLGSRQIVKINNFATSLGLKALWAGGITLPQVFEFGKLGVFGVYVTSAASDLKPVTGKYKRDPLQAARKKPSYEGVLRTKLLLEAGFLTSQATVDIELKKQIEKEASEFIRALESGKKEDATSAQKALTERAILAWRQHLRATPL